MTAKCRSSVDALEQSKLDAMKELAYGASHEINNPLANISARAQALMRDEADPERRRALEAIHQQALRAHEMIADLMLFARPPRLTPMPVDVAKLVGEVVDELAPECRRRNVELRAETAGSLPAISADEAQLAVAVRALAANAIEAVGRDGWVRVKVERSRGAANRKGTFLRIEVSDNGPGIPAAVRPHIFEPFYSGREAGRGLGFGLSKCWRNVTEHGGRMSVASPAEGGAALAIEIPLKAAAGGASRRLGRDAGPQARLSLD
jgi:signal transduction histidine kinase